jgi:hypothetical protein
VEYEHIAQVFLMLIGKTALYGKLVSISKSAKESVPPSNVSIIKRVNIQLMVDRVMLRTLNKVTNPTGSAQIAVVDILTQHGEDIEPRASRG